MATTSRYVKRKLTRVEEHNTKACLAHACEFLDGDGIASVMGLYPYDEQLQQECCRALANTLEEFVSKNSKVKITIARWMGNMSHKTGFADERVITTMIKFSDNEYIQTYGCSIIANLVSVSSAKMRFITLGAIDVVCTAMYAFPTSQLIQLRGCNAIYVITNSKYHKTKRTNFDVPAVCDVIVRAMTHFETVEEIQVHGLMTLSCVLGWMGYYTTSLFLNVPDCIVAATRRYPANEVIQTLACESFKYLSTVDDAIEELLKSGVVDVLFTVMRAFTTSENIQADGVYIFLRIVEQKNANLVALIEAGLGEVVFAATNMTEMDCNKDLILDVCKIVQHVVLNGRLPVDISDKFKPKGGGSVYDKIEEIRDTLYSGYISDGSVDDFDRQLEDVAERLWYLQEKLDAIAEQWGWLT